MRSETKTLRFMFNLQCSAGKKRPADAEAAADSKKSKVAEASAGGTGSTAQSAGKPASSAPVVTGNPQTDAVLEYLRRQNRPYSSIQIEDNMHKSIARKAIDAAITELEQQNHVKTKAFGKTVLAWYNQDKYKAMLDQAGETAGKAAVAVQKAGEAAQQRKALEAQVRALESAPKLADLTAKVAELTKKKEELAKRVGLARAASEKGVITAGKKSDIVASLAKYRAAWSTRKDIVTEVLDAVCEGSESKEHTPAKLFLKIGLTSDADAGADLKAMSVQALAARLGVTPLSLQPPPKPVAAAKAGKAAGKGAAPYGASRPMHAPARPPVMKSTGAGAGAGAGMGHK